MEAFVQAAGGVGKVLKELVYLKGSLVDHGNMSSGLNEKAGGYWQGTVESNQVVMKFLEGGHQWCGCFSGREGELHLPDHLGGIASGLWIEIVDAEGENLQACGLQIIGSIAELA